MTSGGARSAVVEVAGGRGSSLGAIEDGLVKNPSLGKGVRAVSGRTMEPGIFSMVMVAVAPGVFELLGSVAAIRLLCLADSAEAEEVVEVDGTFSMVTKHELDEGDSSLSKGSIISSFGNLLALLESAKLLEASLSEMVVG